ncbi:uncharacterized protein N7498_002241 [Penicillium cinerascens]|uniref:Uncharacterized protein n=1 Tax=Penicillium cinerascens TaxID=70096 RepID=A0A9W9N9S1_9EURO|nr:uncharacterized protein N7498_002241 [Penicillium cinerascens]KAJ5215834.1 hypothetical protein N7498_002241 [Penicillium cinerascens]
MAKAVSETTVVLSLARLYLSQIEFVRETETLFECDPNNDICEVYCYYRKPISFLVRYPSERITISLRIGRRLKRKISGFL